MKKVVVSIALVLILASLFMCFSVGITTMAEGASAYDMADSFLTTCPLRSFINGTAESVAAGYIANKLQSFGYMPFGTDYVSEYTVQYYASQSTQTVTTGKAYNVIGAKTNAASDKYVVVGVSYGGYNGESTDLVGTGASIGLSVGAALKLAQNMATATLDYNLVFVFFGAYELSSSCAVDAFLDFTGIEDKVVLFVGFDHIGAGSNDYFYTDDVSRSHDSIVKSAIKAVGANIKAAPVLKIQRSYIGATSAMGYLHLGLEGPNADFMARDIPAVSILSGAWEYDSGNYRYVGKDDIEGTKLDTLVEINKRNGGRANTEKRLTAAVNSVTNLLLNDQLLKVADEAQKDISTAKLDNQTAYYCIMGIGAACLLAFLIAFYIKCKKEQRSANPPEITIVDSAQENGGDSIFDLGDDGDKATSSESKGEDSGNDNNQNNGKDDGDDDDNSTAGIFGF